MSSKGISAMDTKKKVESNKRHYIVLTDSELESAKKKYGVTKPKELKAKFLA